jgi:hypothetical protein
MFEDGSFEDRRPKRKLWTKEASWENNLLDRKMKLYEI